MGIQATQLDFFLIALQVPGVSCIAPVIALNLQQLDLSTQRGQLCLLGCIGMPKITDLIATGIQLGTQAFLGQLSRTQALTDQRKLSMMTAGTAKCAR